MNIKKYKIIVGLLLCLSIFLTFQNQLLIQKTSQKEIVPEKNNYISSLDENKIKNMSEIEFRNFMSQFATTRQNPKDYEKIIELKIGKLQKIEQIDLIQSKIYNDNINRGMYESIFRHHEQELTKLKPQEIKNIIFESMLKEIEESNMEIIYLDNKYKVHYKYKDVLNKYGQYLSQDYIDFYSFLDKNETTSLFDGGKLKTKNVLNNTKEIRDLVNKVNDSFIYQQEVILYKDYLGLLFGTYDYNTIINTTEMKVNQYLLNDYDEFIKNNPKDSLSKYLLKYKEFLSSSDIETINLNFAMLVDEYTNELIPEKEFKVTPEDASDETEQYYKNLLDIGRDKNNNN